MSSYSELMPIIERKVPFYVLRLEVIQSLLTSFSVAVTMDAFVSTPIISIINVGLDLVRDSKYAKSIHFSFLGHYFV
jgi:hypothetical protein